MKITINKKEYELCFNYKFIKFVMAEKKWQKFSQYDAFVSKLSFEPDDFSPEHFEFFSELVWWGVSANLHKKSTLKVEDIAVYFWSNMAEFQRVMAFFISCQPKTDESVNPETRGN